MMLLMNPIKTLRMQESMHMVREEILHKNNYSKLRQHGESCWPLLHRCFVRHMEQQQISPKHQNSRIKQLIHQHREQCFLEGLRPLLRVGFPWPRFLHQEFVTLWIRYCSTHGCLLLYTKYMARWNSTWVVKLKTKTVDTYTKNPMLGFTYSCNPQQRQKQAWTHRAKQ